MNNTLNKRIMVFDIPIPKGVYNKTKGIVTQDKKTLNMVCTNLVACLRKGSKLTYSRVSKGVVSKRGINISKVLAVIDKMEREGYIINHISKGHPDPDQRELSYISATDKFINLFSDLIVRDECEEKYMESFSTVELRDKDKKPIPYKDNPLIQRISEGVRQLNLLNEKAIIADGNTPLVNFYCRIFNENFERGGRWYRADILRMKNRQGMSRLGITINDSPVAEADYSNLHFRIAAVKEGIDSTTLPLDVYSGILPYGSSRADRKIVKVAVNILFNSGSLAEAKRAITYTANCLSSKDKDEFTLGSSGQIVNMIYDAYPNFSHLFCQGDYGLTLQNDDSNLAADVIEEFVRVGTPVLPVHDSFVVEEQWIDFLVDTMADKFRMRFEFDDLVPITVKQVVDGQIIRNCVLS